MIPATLIAEAKAFGFQAHQDENCPAARPWCWTLMRDGWRHAEVSADCFATEAEAWGDAIVAHANELMEA